MKVALSLAAILIIGGTACSSVQTVRNPAEFLTTRPDLVVVTYHDNSEVPISQPQMRGDTLFGTWQGLNEPVVVPMHQVKRVDAIQRDSKRTALLIFWVSAATVVTTYGFIRAVTDYGEICDYTRPEGRQCYDSSPD